MATKNGRTESVDDSAAEAEAREVRYTIAGQTYAMRLQSDLSYAEYLRFSKVNKRIAPINVFFENDDDDDDFVPPEVIEISERWHLAMARMGFPDVPAGVWHALRPMEITTLANAFMAEMSREPEGNVQPAGSTPAGFSTPSPASNGSTEPLTLVSG